jgi:hypothetical protein
MIGLIGSWLLIDMAFKLSIVQHLARWIVCTPLSVNVFVRIATQYHLEYHCKALFETPFSKFSLS